MAADLSVILSPDNSGLRMTGVWIPCYRLTTWWPGESVGICESSRGSNS
jgi:hypothetical protein